MIVLQGSGGMIMAKSGALAGREAVADRPVVRNIRVVDLKEVLIKGLNDFKEKPSHIVLLVVIYPIVGLLSARLAAGYDILPLIFPLISGFALIGPLAAIGLYELSHRREKGLEVAWKNAFDVFHSPSIGSIVALGGLLMVIFLVWLVAALAVYDVTFGSVQPESIADFVAKILGTSAGWTLIVVGCGVGFLFAVTVLAISVVSFPMLLDKDVGAAVAVQTSIRAVTVNPVTMSVWGLIVAGALIVGSIPFFVGLAVVMPVLGHSTWHLYRKVVEP
jgi:uncharacterized membrane protein